MISAYHIVWTAYGWWLPNDPRGSNSRIVRNGAIADMGPLHAGRKRILPASAEIRRFYEVAGRRLVHPLLTFSRDETAAIGAAFGNVMRDRTYTCYAAAIMPDHVHLVIRKHRDTAETMIENLQRASREAIQRMRTDEHPVWGGPGWKVYLQMRQQIERTIAYVERNPAAAGLRSQRWPFVVTYDGWLAGIGGRRAKPQAFDDAAKDRRERQD